MEENKNEINLNIYQVIRDILSQARKKVYTAVNFAMVESYWEIGRLIEESVGERAEYGKGLMKYLSEQLCSELSCLFEVG